MVQNLNINKGCSSSGRW